MQPQQVILPTVKEPWTDDANEPQFIKVRGNNTSTLYINDITDDSRKRTQFTLANGLYFQNIKRLKFNKLIVNKEGLFNINTYNNRFKGTLTLTSTGAKTLVDVIIPASKVTNPDDLLAYLTFFITNGYGSQPVLNPVTAVPQITFIFQTGGWQIYPAIINKNEIIMKVGNGYTFEWDTECSFYKNGSSMFGFPVPATSTQGSTIGDQGFRFVPTYLPYTYINVISNTLCKYNHNKSLDNQGLSNDIIYRYYFETSYNESNEGWINWNKSGIPSFDIKLTDPLGVELELKLSGSSFIAGEILMEQ